MNTSDSGKLPHIQMLSLALFQGLALFAIYKAIDLKVWPYSQPAWIFALITAVITTPLMAQLTIFKGTIKQTLTWLLPFNALAIAVAAYTGFQAEPVEFIQAGTLVFPFIITLGIACFKALMYIQQYSSNEPISYAALFRYSWRNFLVLCLSLLFVLIFWGVLMLWAALFKTINVEFFSLLFEEKWFMFPALSLACGFAIITFRNLTDILDVIANVLQAMIKFLLPLLVAISVMFMIALPITGFNSFWGTNNDSASIFSGLNSLWKTGHGSALILWLQTLILFFVNAVYQDENRITPYTATLHRFIYFGVALLPIYSAIAFYGLYLRVGQYGWSVDRCWGMLIWLLLALFSTGYCWGIVRHRDNWIRTLSRVNIVMGLIILVTMLLVNSPLLDFRKISTNSQLAQFNSGKISIENFDIRYIARHLARPGYLALQNFKVEHTDKYPEIVATIDELYRSRGMDSSTPDLQTFSDQLVIWPSNIEVPASLIEKIFDWRQENNPVSRFSSKTILLALDLNDDGGHEFIILDQMNWPRAQLWRRIDETWQSSEMNVSGDWMNLDLVAIIESGDITVTMPEWKQIRLGDLLISVDGNITLNRKND
ncbi:MAG: DUF4153 domain-containing protein [Gammaproteobacteria bacterium]